MSFYRMAKHLTHPPVREIFYFSFSLFFNPKTKETKMDQLTNGNFVAGTVYDLTLSFDGKFFPVQLTYLGTGETIGNEECGHFLNAKTGTIHRLTKAAAIACLPKPWAVERAEF